jgi:hypothetical protein
MNETIEMEYSFLFKNGESLKVKQKALPEEFGNINGIITKAFNDNLEGVITFGEDREGTFIRLSELASVSIKLLSGVDKDVH